MDESFLAALLQGDVLVVTGAGISVASGIPTFRGQGGLYEGLNPYELATPEAFRQRPLTVWNWYGMRIRQGRDAKPNPAHMALAKLQDVAKRITIITSNVDPLHTDAGSKRVYRLHGNILQTLCSGCGAVAPLDPHSVPDRYEADTLPKCSCGSMLRPNVVWFGERPGLEAFEVFEDVLRSCDVLLKVGTSGVVSYGLTQHAVQHGVPVYRINPEADSEEGVFHVTEPAEEFLPRIVELAGSTKTEDSFETMETTTTARDVEKQFFAALLAADANTLDRILLPDFVLVDVMMGSVIGKEMLLGAIGAQMLKFEKVEVLESEARTYPGTTVIVGRTQMSGNFDGNPWSVASRYTHVFIQKDGQWKFASAQGTQIVES